jgi:hypothetical protein
MTEREATVTDVSSTKPDGRRTVWLRTDKPVANEHAAALGRLILELLAKAAHEGVDTATVCVRLTGVARGS